MSSPFMTVAVLTVLWLIVVVPMIVRRSDDHARERTLISFGRSMRALGRRAGGPSLSAGEDVFVSGRRVGPSTRRPVPTPQEALMYPVDRREMSEARTAMMARRRRSLTILGVGSLVSLVFALASGGAVWVLAVGFLASLAGYCWFLRSQVMRDRERRANRQARASVRRTRGHDVSEAPLPAPLVDETIVRIDDDDIALQTMDTIDLTGLYVEEPPSEARRAS